MSDLSQIKTERISTRIPRAFVLHLFNAVIFFVIYGSLYPFNFSLDVLTLQSLENFLESWGQFGGRGDILGNIALFVPFGAIGMLSLPRGRALSPHFILIALIGFILAASVQVAQLIIPARDAVLGDVLWNMLGLVFGAVSFASQSLRESILNRSTAGSTMLPLLLIGGWFAAELAPFVPTIDFQAIKTAVKPLFLHPNFDFLDFFRAYVAWLAVAYLAAHARLRIRDWHFLLCAMALMHVGKIIILNNVVTVADPVAAAAAFATWFLILRNRPNKSLIMTVLLVSLILYAGLEPFNLHDKARAFHWIPFSGALNGSMLVNAQASLAKFFFYSALLHLLFDIGFRHSLSIVICSTAIAAIEILQMWVGAHTPEITDPILVLFAGIVLFVLYTPPSKEEIPAQPPSTKQNKKLNKTSHQSSGLLKYQLRDIFTRQRIILFIFGSVFIAVSLHFVLKLPKIPYNVREILGGENNWFNLILFGAALLSVGVGAALTGYYSAFHRKPFIALPSGVIFTCFTVYLALQGSVTHETLMDVTGSANTYYYVTKQDMWGEAGKSFYLFIGSSYFISVVEFCIRFISISSHIVFWLAIFSAVYVSVLRRNTLSFKTSIMAIATESAKYIMFALPWLILFNLISFKFSSTDNLNELIQNRGHILYFILPLIGIATLSCCLTISTRSFQAKTAFILTYLATIPVSWYLLKYGLSPAVQKYKMTYSGVQFLLGPDRKQILPENILMLRWYAVYIAMTVGLAYSMIIIFLRPKQSRRLASSHPSLLRE